MKLATFNVFSILCVGVRVKQKIGVPMKLITNAFIFLVVANHVQAFEELDDGAMSHVSGKEGITIDRTYKQNIEEITFVDGDGVGNGIAGAVSLKGIAVGDFIGSDMQDNTAVTQGLVTVEGMKIDAVENGVLITHGRVDGLDITIDSVEIGKSDGSGMGNIGSIQIINQSNYLSLQQATSMNDKFNLGINMEQYK